MNIPYFISLSTIIKIKLNFVLIISSLNCNNFIIKFNNIKLYTLSGTCNNYSSLYSKRLEFLVL